jgi:hypothetical protein
MCDSRSVLLSLAQEQPLPKDAKVSTLLQRIHSCACSLVHSELSWWGFNSMYLHTAHMQYCSHYSVDLCQSLACVSVLFYLQCRSPSRRELRTQQLESHMESQTTTRGSGTMRVLVVCKCLQPLPFDRPYSSVWILVWITSAINSSISGFGCIHCIRVITKSSSTSAHIGVRHGE